ncbi:MAG: hypothetical protein HY537_09460 [Deltaproteobacteria bacterium]|nr:hypothetical protein [Deltaproteobacteria bacterium]
MNNVITKALRMLLKWGSPFLKWLGISVYGAFVPVPDTRGAGSYLVDLWKHAPSHVAAAHTIAALIILFLPPLMIGKLSLFSALPRRDKDRMLEKLIHSKHFWFRMIAYGVRGHAMVATFRFPETKSCLKEERSEIHHGKQISMG